MGAILGKYYALDNEVDNYYLEASQDSEETFLCLYLNKDAETIYISKLILTKAEELNTCTLLIQTDKNYVLEKSQYEYSICFEVYEEDFEKFIDSGELMPLITYWQGTVIPEIMIKDTFIKLSVLLNDGSCVSDYCKVATVYRKLLDWFEMQE